MKYLKLYNESKDRLIINDESINHLKDILLDISDYGFHTKVIKSYWGSSFTITISRLQDIGFIHNEEELNSFKDVLTHIKEYVKSYNYVINGFDLNMIEYFLILNKHELNNFISGDDDYQDLSKDDLGNTEWWYSISITIHAY
jgi:hypothetical protein